MLPPGAIFVLVVSAIIGALIHPLDSNGLFLTQKREEWPVQAKNILLVTAHPDDEVMFFAPTILSLSQKAANGSATFYHLCLSYGNAEGLGETRKRELGYSLDILGVPLQKRWAVNHPELQDSTTAEWDPNVVARVMKPYVTELKIDTILTFDSSGISSHPNHKSVFTGARTLTKTLDETSSKLPPRLFTLVSAPLVTKYVSIVALVLGKADIFAYRAMQRLENLIILVLSNWYPEILTPAIPRSPDADAMPVFISGYKEYLTSLLAMQAHSSQLVWYRWLYLLFSRYLWANAWVEVQPQV
ncbi:unnamed protein product [Cyclocybe aegerita]|uniref:N-acetylglucosaminylphosphatidylinositol deacetylase n=1 Tax=Cyclocybe aegerita TaxID=1973307 RepID=A0A8S0W905_CYCAE|nr:unnamed protein product [Cyclocybe aegerita]